VLVAEDNLLVRQGLVALLELEPEVEVVGVCQSLDDLLDAAGRVRPDVVLTDVRMPPTGVDEGIRAAQRLRESHPDMGVLVLSQFADPECALALVESGSQGRGYLLKEHLGAPHELVRALRMVAAGRSFIDPLVVDVMLAARSRAGSPMERLTPRERQVLAELATGKSNAAIAAGLGVTERAVEKHINSMFAKLGLFEDADSNRRVKAVLLFLHGGRP
jgi:DNA-binding NarL/FixJ family response regulator